MKIEKEHIQRITPVNNVFKHACITRANHYLPRAHFSLKLESILGDARARVGSTRKIRVSEQCRGLYSFVLKSNSVFVSLYRKPQYYATTASFTESLSYSISECKEKKKTPAQSASKLHKFSS